MSIESIAQPLDFAQLLARYSGAEGSALRSVIDGIGEGFALLGPDFTVLELNLEAVRIDGRRREDVIGRSHWQAYPGTEDSDLGRMYKRVMAQRQPEATEHTYTWPDGRVSRFETRAYPTEDGCIAILFRDDTARWRAVEELRASARRFKAAVQAIEGVMWTNSAAGEMLGEQPAWAALTGQTYEEYQGYGWSAAVHPDDAQPTIDAWQAAVAARKPFEFEHRVRRHDGAWQRCAIRAVPAFDDCGAISEWVGVHRDITDHRLAADQIARNAEMLAQLLDTNPFGIYVVDAHFRLIRISQGAQKVFAGIDPLIGRDFAEVIRIIWQEPFASEVIQRFRHTLETGEPYQSPSTIERRANLDAVEAYDWRIERVALPDGRNRVVCYFYDLSERHAFEAELRQAVADKDLLAREIDHRVKNSLSIVAAVLTMQRSSVASHETRAALAGAVERVIAVARVHESLHKSHALGVVALGQYFRDMCNDLQRTIAGRALTLDATVCDVDLPAERALNLALIANELVTNAFKHGFNAGATQVTLTLEAEPDRIRLAVEDNGSGMPQDFVKASKGLGFRMIESMARQLNTKVEFPQPGAPARFYVEIPNTVPGAED